MPIETITYACDEDGFVVGTDSGFVVWGTIDDPAGKYGVKPAQGAIYNKQTDAWTLMATLQPGAYADTPQRQYALVGNTIYAYGQAFLDDTKPLDFKFPKINAVAEFHIGSNSWNLLTPVGFPTDHRQGTGFIVADNELYLIGGIDGPPWANIIHQDGVRLALPGGKP